MTEPTNETLRSRAKARTRKKVIAAARQAFKTGDYHKATIRDLSKDFGMSTGAIYNSFASKEQLFTEAMGFPPPVDGPLTRAASMLLEAIWQLHDMCEGMSVGTLALKDTDQVRAAHDAIILATSPLDGKAWARHLESIRRDVPHDCRAEQPAALVPSDAAGDL